jgi:predicted outer membrane repeat protein
MRFPRLPFVFLAALAAALTAGPARAATFFVGSIGAGCTHSTLAAAIAAANANGTAFDQIYLTRDESFTGPLAVNGHLGIRGGTLSCGSITRSGRTRLSVLDGSALSIGSYFVDVDSVDFEHLAASGLDERLITATGAFNLYLRHVSLRGGHARLGGNLGLSGSSSSSATLEDVEVSGGTATEFGGGIYCEGRVSLRWTGPVDVAGNHALQNGGGVALSRGCQLDATAGSTREAVIYIRSNTADLVGGGIYLADLGSAAPSATLRGAGGVAAIFGNQAVLGGGAYLSNFDDSVADTRLNLVNVQLWLNAAESTGGGVYGFGKSAILIDRNGSVCPTGRCSVVAGNDARGSRPHPWNVDLTTGQGGAFFLESGAKLTLRQTWVEHSQSLNGASVLATYGYGFGSRVDAEGVAFFANEGNPAAAAISPGAATLRLAFVSSAGNLTASTHRLVSAGQVEIYSSVFGESWPNVLSVAGSSAIDCVIVPTASGLPPGATAVTAISNPALLFVDPVNGNLHLRLGSPAIDYCDNYFYTPVDQDVDGQARGMDYTGMGNYLGLYDIGADEFVP